MPIRFRCVYCDKLLGIGERKAGQEVTCPKCKGRMRVPAPETRSTATANVGSISEASEVDLEATTKVVKSPSRRSKASAPLPAVPIGNKLFENDDFEGLLAAGTLPSPDREIPVAPVIPTQSEAELAGQAAILDRELFAIDLDAPPLPASAPTAVAYSTNARFPWRIMVISWFIVFGLGLGVGYLAFKSR